MSFEVVARPHGFTVDLSGGCADLEPVPARGPLGGKQALACFVVTAGENRLQVVGVDEAIEAEPVSAMPGPDAGTFNSAVVVVDRSVESLGGELAFALDTVG